MVKYLLSVEVRIAEERTTRTGEGEHGKRNRNRDVNANLSNIDILGELSRCRSVGRENGCAIAVRIVVDEIDRIVECVNR